MDAIIHISGPPHPDDWRTEHVATVVLDARPMLPGPRFHTDASAPLQVATTLYPAGHEVPRHTHPGRQRPAFVGPTQELILVRRGRLLVQFWDSAGAYAGSWTLRPGDLCLFLAGWHAHTAVEEVELINVKSGPFVAGQDKAFLPQEGAPR